MAENLCPSEEQLSLYVLGNLDADRLVPIANHLEVCERCRSRAESLEQCTDPLLDELRTSSASDPFDDEPELQHAMAVLLDEHETPPGSPLCKAELPSEFGRYRIQGEVGAGNMGTVYLAYDTQLERQVALKVPHFRPKDNPKLRARFLRESKAAAAVHHPNICPIYDAGEIDGICFFAMPFVDGEPLSTVIGSRRPMEIPEAVSLVRMIAVAMQEAHNKGVIHRDLKPDNVLVNQRGEPVVTDFGLASRNEELVEEARLSFDGMLIGSPAYMSPEQVNGEIALFGPACDIYSLGVILFELLTGERPYGGNLTSVLAQISRDPPPQPSSRRQSIPASLDGICTRAMAKEPGQRYSSMSEFATRLGDYLEGRLDGDRNGVSEHDGDMPQIGNAIEKATPGAAVVSQRTFRDFARAHLLLILLGLSIVCVLGLALAMFLPPRDGTIQIVVTMPDVTVYIDEVLRTPEELSHPIVLTPGMHTWMLKKGDIRIDYKPFPVNEGDNARLIIPALRQLQSSNSTSPPSPN